MNAPLVPPEICVQPSLRKRSRWGWKTIFISVILAPFLSLAVVIAYGLSCLVPTHSTRELSTIAIHGSGGNWTWRGSARIDAVPLMAARFVSGFMKQIPPEARLALQAARSGEVTLYERVGGGYSKDYRRLLTDADRFMQHSGFERVVGVLEGPELVAIYLPTGLHSQRQLNATVLVVNDSNLVVASATADLVPLFHLVRGKIVENHPYAFTSTVSLQQKGPLHSLVRAQKSVD